MFKRFKIRKYEVGLLFKDEAFEGILREGTHTYFDPFSKIRVDVVSVKEPLLKHERIEELVLSKKLGTICLTWELSSSQCAFEWIDGNLTRIVPPGFHAWWTDYHDVQVEIQDCTTPWITHAKLQQIVNSGLLDDAATVIDLQDQQRALVWIDGRFSTVLAPGLYAYWNGLRDVRVEIVDTGSIRFEHAELTTILASLPTSVSNAVFDICTINRHHVGVLFYDGKYIETLLPGVYAFWKKTKSALVSEVDMRELMFDITGQEIMTSDKVSLRLNAGINYRIVDAPKCLAAVPDIQQAIYKESQLILREVVGTRELDVLLVDKNTVASETAEKLRTRIADWGIELVAIGIRDIILPGEMKDLLNKVTEAKKAAEANLIARREETAAMRSQANTAKILEGNPTLMRLRELEVIEKTAAAGKLSVIIAEKGIGEKIVNLL